MLAAGDVDRALSRGPKGRARPAAWGKLIGQLPFLALRPTAARSASAAQGRIVVWALTASPDGGSSEVDVGHLRRWKNETRVPRFHRLRVLPQLSWRAAGAVHAEVGTASPDMV